eukprot:TRINITY_DN1013_c0_g1_i1.p1 TRINITY_DN1013_c0_g1~~TRINITY_DN1013_c0_g1_i1.p1  ORF type:complete len:305 (-),score=101.40 TRINITY_DN1013_c0_g1_i1:4-918(-)
MGNNNTSNDSPKETQSNEYKTNINENTKNNEKEKIPFELPEYISLKHVLNEEDDGGKWKEKFVEIMRKYSFAIFSDMDPKYHQLFEDLKEVKIKYFTQEKEVKEKNASVGQKGLDNTNMGFVHVKDMREYIKLRPGEGESYWPQYPENFKEVWDNVFKLGFDVSWNCLSALGKTVTREGEKPLLDDEKMNAIEEFVSEKSSLSLIRYFPQTGEGESDVCDAHCDTGILTFFFCSSVPGLEFYDRNSESWVQIENLIKPNTICCFLGRKIELFGNNPNFKSLLHRVRVPTNTERYSIVYLLDVAK